MTATSTGSTTGGAPKQGQTGCCKPVKDFFGTEFVIGKIFVASNAVWISLIFLLMSIVFFLIAYATVGWGRADSADGTRRNVGLWQECHSVTGCRYHGSGDISSGFKASQAFATLSLVGLLAAVVGAVFYVFSVDYQRKIGPGVALYTARLSTAVFLLITISVFPATWTQGRYTAHETSTQYSYALAVTAFVTELIACILMTAEVFFIRDFCCGPTTTTSGSPMTSDYYSSPQYETQLHVPQSTDHRSARLESAAADNMAFHDDSYEYDAGSYSDRKSNPMEDYMLYAGQANQQENHVPNGGQFERGYTIAEQHQQPQAPPRKKGGRRFSLKRSSKRRSKSKERGRKQTYETLGQERGGTGNSPSYEQLNHSGARERTSAGYNQQGKEYQHQDQSRAYVNAPAQPSHYSAQPKSNHTYKKHDQPSNTPSRYSQPQSGHSAGGYNQQTGYPASAPGTPSSTRGKYDQPPGTPSSTRGKYDQPPGTPSSTRGKYDQPPGTPSSTRGKYDQPPGTPSSTRGKYDQPPGTPSSTRGKYDQPPGTPSSTRGKYDQPPGTPSSTRGKYDQPPGTPSSSRGKYDQPPGTPSSTRGKYDQPPGTPSSTRGKYDQPPGTPSSTRGKYDQPPSTPSSTRGKYDQPPGTPSSTRGKYDQPPGTPSSSRGKYDQPPGTPSSTRGYSGQNQTLSYPATVQGAYPQANRAPSSQPGTPKSYRAPVTTNYNDQGVKERSHSTHTSTGGSTSQRSPSGNSAPPSESSMNYHGQGHESRDRQRRGSAHSTTSDNVFTVYTSSKGAAPPPPTSGQRSRSNSSSSQPEYAGLAIRMTTGGNTDTSI